MDCCLVVGRRFEQAKLEFRMDCCLVVGLLALAASGLESVLVQQI
jgi:hypothetical protein